MNISRLLLLGSVWFAATISIVSAERAALSPEKLDRESTHVVEGKVLGVYRFDDDSWQLYGPGTIVERIVVEIEVSKVIKGEDVVPKNIVYARCWNLKKHGANGLSPGPGGHFVIPKKGDIVKAHLARGSYAPTAQTDDGYAALYPNGIELLIPPAAPTK